MSKKNTEILFEVVLETISVCGKWCHFYGYKKGTNNFFFETGKLWYIGTALERSGINIDPWSSYGFEDVIKELIILKIPIGWSLYDGCNLFPDRITDPGDIEMVKEALKKLKNNNFNEEEKNIRKEHPEVVKWTTK